MNDTEAYDVNSALSKVGSLLQSELFRIAMRDQAEPFNHNREVELIKEMIIKYERMIENEEFV